MTVESYSSLPFSAGGALAGAMYRSALAGVALFMRQPLRNTAVVGLAGLCALAGSNALYRQHHHPAPLFGSFDATEPSSSAHVVKEPKAVMPIERPARLGVDTSDTTGNIAPQAAVAPTPAPAPTVIGRDDVIALQKKLTALNFFTGTADGLFGAKTAAAIRAFEQSVGRPARGMLTPQIVALITAAPLPQPVPPAPVGAPASAKPTATAASPPTKPVASDLPAPSPLAVTDKPAIEPASAPAAAASSSSAAVSSQAPAAPSSAEPDPSSTPMQTASLQVTKRPVQAITVHAAPAQPLPAQLAAPTDGTQATNDPDVVAQVQRGLNSLGFLRGNITGIADEATAKAVRNFEVFYNYEETGRVTKELVNLLTLNGATV